ncbi:MAG: LysR family transcriptional regulator [Clostridiales bacterium]|nr:LysR family transcriptional regulator [Clostridiales bacterium]
MDLKLLEEFACLAETCSFQETAEKMNISKSSLTKHIHKLEEELGVTFFDRSTRTVQLNAYSQAYYPYVKQMIQLHQEAVQSLTDIRNESRNKLRIAFTPTVGQYGVVEVISAFSRAHPQYDLKILESPHVLDMINSHECDFGFLPEDDSINSNVSQLVFKTDRLVAVLPENHPLAAEPRLTPEQICASDTPIILPANPSSGHYLETRKFLAMCSDRGIAPNVLAVISRTSTIIKMIQEGLGISILNRQCVPESDENLTIVDLQPSIPLYIYVVYPTRKKKSAAVSSFLRFIIKDITETE